MLVQFNFVNINEGISNSSKNYICDYNLKFNFSDKNFIDDIKEELLKRNTNPLSDKNFIINSLLENDSDDMTCKEFGVRTSQKEKTKNLYMVNTDKYMLKKQ